jgi:predicted secreted protein
MSSIDLRIATHIQDARGKRVVFVSHCILNQNVRYTGGAFRKGCVSEVVAQLVAEGVGIVQLPCPEAAAWGGVTKPLLLRAWGNRLLRVPAAQRAALAVFLRRTRRIYERLAHSTAREIASYRDAGVEVVAVVGIDGSPSCGVRKTVNVHKSLPLFAALDLDDAVASDVNAIVRSAATKGAGMFIEALASELRRRKIAVPIIAHDLFAEMHHERRLLDLPGAPPAIVGRR